MTKKISKSEFLTISLMLFSMFFGAGNLIFPTMLGKLAGPHMLLGFSFFSITAVLLPVLGIFAIAKSNGMENLTARVDPKFSVIFTSLVYLAIGPLLAIPRCGSTPYEIVIAPYLPPQIPQAIALAAYTFLFFLASYYLSLNPKKMVQQMGGVLTPILLILIALLFIVSLIYPLGSFGEALEGYKIHPASQGFLDGYQTMDTIAALNFGIVIIVTVKSLGIQEEKIIQKTMRWSSVLAGGLLILVYFLLAHIGGTSALSYPDSQNGAQILLYAAQTLFGKFGGIILAAIFILACLTTSIGLITSISRYFADLVPKINYKQWVRGWTLLSFLIANIGLNAILKMSVPLLRVIYPIAIVLIILGLLHKVLKLQNFVYQGTVYVTLIISVIKTLGSLGIKFEILFLALEKLPLFEQDLVWMLPALVVFLLSYAWQLLRQGRSGEKV